MAYGGYGSGPSGSRRPRRRFQPDQRTIIIVVVAAVFTPSSDPFSMLALALPLIVFYFLSIGIGKLLGR